VCSISRKGDGSILKRSGQKNLLIVSNFSANTGYAWHTIKEYFLALSKMFHDYGCHATICYPHVDRMPEELIDAGAEIVEFDFFSKPPMELFRFLRGRRTRVLYLTDRPAFSVKYLLCRIAGVKRIVVHDRTSGHRETPGPLKRIFKRMINVFPILSADRVISISEYVRQRLIRVSCFPEWRTVKIWNGIDIKKFRPGWDDFVFEKYNIPRDKKVVFASSRANKYKGIQVLIEAAHILVHEKGRSDLFFLYCGDGPDLEYFRSLVNARGLGDHFLCPGKSDKIDRILRGASLVIVPSLWQEGFGLSVVEGMASGKVVIASRVGGIVEIIDDGEDGYLIPPGNSEVLSEVIMDVVEKDRLMEKIGAKARKKVVEKFDINEKKGELLSLFRAVVFENT
jgi:glycosyltransferase involved in cell wall biosynthesis